MARQVITPINYYSSRALVQLFDTCYKMGVEDAIQVNDVFRCQDWVEEKYKPSTFSRIIHNYDMSWQEWKFRLSGLVRDGKYKLLGVRFFDCITSYNGYYAASLPIAMDFYMKGIKDYCERPKSGEWVLFNSGSFNRWGKKKILKISQDDIIREVTEFSFDRIRLDEELHKSGRRDEQGRIGLSGNAYHNFYKELWRYTRVKEKM